MYPGFHGGLLVNFVCTKDKTWNIFYPSPIFSLYIFKFHPIFFITLLILFPILEYLVRFSLYHKSVFKGLFYHYGKDRCQVLAWNVDYVLSFPRYLLITIQCKRVAERRSKGRKRVRLRNKLEMELKKKSITEEDATTGTTGKALYIHGANP